MNETLETFVPFQLKRRKSRLVDTERTGHEPFILEAIGRAMHWQKLLDDGIMKSGTEIAQREGLDLSTVSRLLHLALLSPELIDLFMAGRQPRTLTLKWLQRNRLPNDWQEQRTIIDQFD